MQERREEQTKGWGGQKEKGGGTDRGGGKGNEKGREGRTG